MFACPVAAADTHRPGTQHPIAGSLPAVNLSRPARRERTEPFAKLALAELEALAGTLLPVLLAFLHARIAGQKTILAQARSQLRIEDRQRARKPHAHRAGLSADAAAIHRGHNVHGSRRLRKFHRLNRAIAPSHIAKIFFRIAAVDGNLARPERQEDARNGFLASAGSVKLLFCAFRRLCARTQRSSSDTQRQNPNLDLAPRGTTGSTPVAPL